MKIEHCNGCSACAASCPKDAIQMVEGQNGFYTPKIIEELCIHCGICEKVCEKAHKILNTEETALAYVATNKDERVIRNSSSGGAFRAIAEEVIAHGGVVFGCAWTDDLTASHIPVYNLENLNKLQKSKYVQSYVGKCYKDVKRLLDEGQFVLFSGTPCQVSGLHAFLAKNYPNLVTCDFICHGVPSIRSLREYIELVENEYQKKVVSIDFRDKTYGWEELAIKIATADGDEYIEKASENPYYRAFLGNLSINDACTECCHNILPRKSDITLADFWGIGNTKYSYDKMGTSALIINTQKGRDLINKIQSLNLQATSIQCVMKGNPFLNGHCTSHPRQKTFMAKQGSEKFDVLVEKLLKPTPLEYAQEVGKYQAMKLVGKAQSAVNIIQHNFEVRKRKRALLCKDITIISNNCWGGFIYQKYGLEYQTPTIGLYFLGDDFVKFCTHLDEYLSRQLTFIPWQSSRFYPELKDVKPYPVGKLGDIEVYFMHYHSEEEAREKWERRKSRINKERILFKLSQRECCSKEDIEKFMALPYKNKICFAYDKVPGAIYVPELRGFSGDEQPIVTPYLDDLELLNGLK